MVHILHLEDSALDHDLVQRTLRRDAIDASVLRVSSRAEFAEAFAQQQWDAVLADYQLPGYDGLAALHHVRETHRELPFIFVSGVLGEEIAIDTLKAGATDYVLKTRLQRLVPAVERALHESEDRRKRRAAEDALFETEHRFQAMANSAPVLLWVIGPTKNCEFFNHQWLEFTGRTLDDELRCTWTDSIYAEDQQRWTELFESRFAQRESFSTELRLRRADGQYRWLALNSSPRFSSSGAFLGMIGSAIDFTERKQAEERLLHVAKLESLGVMAGGIAHDFNNLLTGIVGHAELLKDGLTPGSPDMNLIDSILQAGESAAQLTRQMLAYSGRGRFVIEPVDLTVLVRKIRALIDVSIPRNVRFELELQDPLPLIDADPGQIQQVLMNLIINAGEASEKATDGAVRVRTYSANLASMGEERNLTGEALQPGRFAVVEVSDNGTGMDPETQARIFDPFFTTKFTGRGLGLAAVLGIARGHKAGIRLRSTPGHGSTFTLLFPQGSQQKMNTESGPRENHVSKAATVLVVDDEPLVLRFAALVLARSGFRVVTGSNGEEALEKLREPRARFDLILLDAVMPKMGGEETLRNIRLRHPGIPIIGMSGFSEAEATERFGDQLDAFIQKPFMGSQLIRKIAAVLPVLKQDSK